MKYDSEQRGAARFLGELEAEILEILWERGTISAKEVQLQLRIKKKLASTTIHTVLSRLEKKQIISSDKSSRIALWSACASRKDFLVENIRELTQSLQTEFPAEFKAASSKATKKAAKRGGK